MKMTYNHLIVVILLLALFANLSQSQPIPDLCLPHDKNVLLRVKKHFGNPSSMSSWDPKTDCAGWNGVRCNIQGNVVTVQITDAEDIKGPIPPFFYQLPFITVLSFSRLPNLSGPIPSSIGKLTNLTEFSISGTKVTGPIPEFLGQLTNLNQVLDLSSNKFTGPIPNFLGRLKSLTNLDLSSNLLTGPIPVALAQLTNIQLLTLSSNRLSGKIPEFIAQKLKNLAVLQLDFNAFSGPIPASLGFMPNIQTIQLAGNQLTGSVPKSLARGNLDFLYLSQNKLTGDVSFLFEKPNTNILILEIGDNLFKFDLTNVNMVPSLSRVNISHNMIYGSLPIRFGLLKPDSIDVSYNQLCGPIPNGRRFKQVNPIIFSHNKCLCGGPFPGCK